MPYNDLLFRRLRAARRDELEELLEATGLKQEKFRLASDDDLVSAISKKLRSAAGHSFANPFRGDHDLAYRRILIDVADKLAPGFGPWKWTSFKMKGPETDEQIEDSIHQRFLAMLEERLAKLSPEKRAELQTQLVAVLEKKGVPQHVVVAASGAIAAGAITGAAAGPAVAWALFGGFWTWIFGLSLGQLLIGGFLVGAPAGVVAAGFTFLLSPSYRKTVPAVLRLILIRQSREAEASLAAGTT